MTIGFTAEWYKNYFEKKDNYTFTINQIKKFLKI